jgi:hypothetical protein
MYGTLSVQFSVRAKTMVRPWAVTDGEVSRIPGREREPGANARHVVSGARLPLVCAAVAIGNRPVSNRSSRRKGTRMLVE